jgi:hypothetical protein
LWLTLGDAKATAQLATKPSITPAANFFISR